MDLRIVVLKALRIEITTRSGIESTTDVASAEVIFISLFHV